jgi:hypothetical protein
VDGRTGSVGVGKVAGLRHTRGAMMDGKLMDADALRAPGGFEGRPKFTD